MYTREQLETALDAGQLEAHMGGGRYWRARRNGKTRTLKTRPDEFVIPVKAGFRSHGLLTHSNMNDYDNALRPTWRIV